MSARLIHTLFLLSLTLGLNACASSGSQSASEQVVCRTERQVGSNIPTRICGAQSSGRTNQPVYVIGAEESEIGEGARLLIAGKYEEGIKLTLSGLETAGSEKQEVAALSNLCAGYTNLKDYKTALTYCDMALERNDELWRAYNSKALIYIYTKQYDKAEQALIQGEAINPNARTMKIARAIYMDETKPVVPEIQVDDRQLDNQ